MQIITYTGHHKDTGDPIVCEHQDIEGAKKAGFLFGEDDLEQEVPPPDDPDSETLSDIEKGSAVRFTEEALQNMKKDVLLRILAVKYDEKIDPKTTKQLLIDRVLLQQAKTMVNGE